MLLAEAGCRPAAVGMLCRPAGPVPGDGAVLSCRSGAVASAGTLLAAADPALLLCIIICIPLHNHSDLQHKMHGK